MALDKEVLNQIQEICNENAVAMIEALLRIAKSTHESADARLGAAQIILEIARGGADLFGPNEGDTAGQPLME